MGKKSAGILLYRKKNNKTEIMLVHPGGPFWAKKDIDVWSIPKGEFGDDEQPLEAAKREFEEEVGAKVLAKDFIELTPVRSKSNKTVIAFAVEEDFDTTSIKSNLIWIDWPPKTGKKIKVPEVDKAEWFDVNKAKEKILSYQLPLIDELVEVVKSLK